MDYFKKVVKSVIAPEDHYVLWIDISTPEFPIMKLYNNGWIPLMADRLVKQTFTIIPNCYVRGSDGAIISSENSSVVEVDIAYGEKIYFLGMTKNHNDFNSGYAFYGPESNVVFSNTWQVVSDRLPGTPIEIEKNIPENAVKFRTTLINDVNADNFYCNIGTLYTNESLADNNKIFYNSTNYWNSQINYIPNEGDLIIYSDYQTVSSGAQTSNIPGIKVGDGITTINNLMFASGSGSAIPDDYVTYEVISGSETIPVDPIPGEGQIMANSVILKDKNSNELLPLTHVDLVQGLDDALAVKYEKPVTGIPATDIATGVIPDVSNFVTTSVNNLVNYYLKSETYTKAEVESLISAISGFSYEIYASTSAVSSPSSNVLYLIGPTGSGSDKYEEYVYSNNTWVKIGDTSIDLSGYYQLPVGGIPATDLASAVQTSLGKADTAYQKPSGGIPKTDLASAVQTSLDKADTALQSFTETDPTVPSWAKASNKPSYSYSEISNTPSLSTVATSGSYTDLSNKPTIPDAQIQSDWNQTNTEAKDYIKNKPNIPSGVVVDQVYDGTSANAQSGVAMAGALADKQDVIDSSHKLSYNLLTDTPTIPAAQVQTDWNATSGMGEILNKPTFAAVATSGSYNDLSNKPSIPSAPGTLNTNNATAQSVNSSEALSGTVNLHKVSKTGNYNDLLNKPTIPEANLFIVAVGYDSTEDEYSITNDVTFSDICDAYEAGKGILLVYTDEDGYASEYTLSVYAADDDYITFSDSQSPEVVKTFTVSSDDSVEYSEQRARTSALTNDSLFVRGQAAIWKGICATSASAAAKFVPCSSFTADDQVVGVMAVVTFSNTNIAATNNLTLNVQSRGAKPIKRLVNGGLADIDKPENLTGTMAFVYDGTNWVTWYESFDDVDGNCLDAKFGNVSLHQWKPDYTMTDGSYVKGADGLLYEYSGAKYVEVPVGDAERVRFLGLYPKYSSWTNGWAFGKYVNDEWVTIESEKFDYDTSQDASYTKEYIKDVPSGATHFRTSSASSSLYALERQFYLYFQTGEPAVSQEELREAVIANPTVPSGTSTTSLTGLKVGSSYYNVSSGGGPVTDVTVGGTSVVSNGVAVVPAIPTVNDATLTIKMNNASKGTFSANAASNTEIDLGTVITSHQDISGKADKVSGATNGHFASLDSNGNLTDSGKGASDFGTYSKPSGGIPASDIASGVIPTVPTISNDIVTDKNSTTKTTSPSAVYNEIYPSIVTTQPNGGFLPNVVYDLGTLTGTITFALAAATDNNIVNAYHWTFETSSTAPTISWPSGVNWLGGSSPVVGTSCHYEIMVRNSYGTFLEFDISGR